MRTAHSKLSLAATLDPPRGINALDAGSLVRVVPLQVVLAASLWTFSRFSRTLRMMRGGVAALAFGTVRHQRLPRPCVLGVLRRGRARTPASLL